MQGEKMVDAIDVEAGVNVVVMKFRALTGLFTQIRDRETTAQEYVHYSKRLMRILAEEAISYLPTSQTTVMTPTNVPYTGHLSIIDTNPEKVCAVSIVRAGDSLLESFRECAPAVRVGKMWIQRDESSKEKNAVHSCTKLPKGIDDMSVILCDPMLATGGSSIAALQTLVEEYGVKQERIIFANVISCPEGLNAVGKAFPMVKIVTAWVDDGLNEEKFILPGLGDYGDRFFNTV
ncbi:hypothetical protein ACHAXS_004228 [Conticribra weissflogii]